MTSLIPGHFLFQLAQDEKGEVVANCDHLRILKFSRAPPFAFTEHGAIQAANVLTMKVSKGLEFPLVALLGVWRMPATGEDEKEAARVFYVAATRETQRLVMGGWKRRFCEKTTSLNRTESRR